MGGMQPRAHWRRVLLIESHPAACLVRSLLVEAGFHPAPIPEAESVFLAGADLGYYVEVLAEEVEASLEFLSAQGYGDNLVRSHG